VITTSSLAAKAIAALSGAIFIASLGGCTPAEMTATPAPISTDEVGTPEIAGTTVRVIIANHVWTDPVKDFIHLFEKETGAAYGNMIGIPKGATILRVMSWPEPSVGYASIDWGTLMPASVVVTTPIMLIALLTQRYIVSGLTVGATKGQPWAHLPSSLLL